MLFLAISTYVQIAYAWLLKMLFGKVVAVPVVSRADHVRYLDKVQTFLFSFLAAFFAMNAVSPLYFHSAAFCWSMFAGLLLLSFNISFGLYFYAKSLDEAG